MIIVLRTCVPPFPDSSEDDSVDAHVHFPPLATLMKLLQMKGDLLPCLNLTFNLRRADIFNEMIIRL